MNGFGYYHVACATPPVSVGDVKANTAEILRIASMCDPQTRLLVFPELCLSGYTCGDLFYESLLLDACEEALEELCEKLRDDLLVVVGVPLRHEDRLYNCAAFLFNHELLGIQVKSYIPNYNEFYEKRWFSSGFDLIGERFAWHGATVPFTTRLLIHDTTTQAVIGADICEDLWAMIPPSTLHALHGANVIVNLSASNESIAKARYRRELVVNQSAKCNCGYVYCSAGKSESTSDLVFSGHDLIADNGVLIREAGFLDHAELLYGEIDLERCRQDRMHYHAIKPSFAQSEYAQVTIASKPRALPLQLTRFISPYPFVPADETDRSKRCHEIRMIQAAGLAQRLAKINCTHLVVGISGGLDSTLALIVAIEAFAMNRYPSENIIAVTMPGFGTSGRTHTNSNDLMKHFHVTAKEIPIHDAVKQHFQDIGHDEYLHDITYENAQARERTQILMDLANQHDAIVLGTGDLSELALGWCTYNGDHMSMYGVNASIPKTLVRYIVETYAREKQASGETALAATLFDICETPVSPELLPPDENGAIAQKTEESIGSYDLHDFFLYHMLRNHFAPAKINALARIAFPKLEPSVIRDTMKTFYRRFFTQQFKRNCMPDGVKVGSICLSPRGDWRMPSDASMALWMREVERL